MNVMIRREFVAFLLSQLLASKCVFADAKCIWPTESLREMNRTYLFQGTFAWMKDDPSPVLRSTGSSIYRVEVNGRFASYGPARGPHGYFREDILDFSPFLVDGTNRVLFTVAGYNVNSYYLLDLPPFLQAEVVAGDRTLWETSAQTEVRRDVSRVQKVSRYSFQRPFGETYRMDAAGATSARIADLAVLPGVRLLPRRAPMPRFEERRDFRPYARGVAARKDGNVKKDRSVELAKPWGRSSRAKV